MCEWKRKMKWSYLEPYGHFLPIKVEWTMVRPLIQGQPILKLNRDVWLVWYEKDIGLEDNPKEEPEVKVGKEKWNVQEKYKAEREKICRVDRKLMRFCNERKSSPVKSQTNMVETTSEEALLSRCSRKLGLQTASIGFYSMSTCPASNLLVCGILCISLVSIPLVDSKLSNPTSLLDV